MAGIFDQTTINGLRLRNRVVRSATWEGMCEDDGRPTEKLARCYRDLAQGGVGLIITGYTFVRPDGKQLPGKMGIHSDAFAGEMKRLVETVHAAGGALCLQLVHAGGQTTTQSAGRQPLAPSAVSIPQFPEVPAAMTGQDIEEVIAAFAAAARRARTWGFDAVQLHGAHGYLINQFLSPLANRRQDEYGGSLANRCRFLMEVYHAVRKEVGSDYPLLIKLNGADFIDGGLTVEDAAYAAAALDQAGVDAIEVSGGTPASGEQGPVRVKIDTPEREGYNLHLARKLKEAVQCPLISVGGFRSFDLAEKVLRAGEVDYISMARPFIREPALVQRWQQGDTSPARCISCNGCFAPGLKEGGIYCVVEQKEREGAQE